LKNAAGGARASVVGRPPGPERVSRVSAGAAGGQFLEKPWWFTVKWGKTMVISDDLYNVRPQFDS